VELPRALAAHWPTEPAWLDHLPNLVADYAEQWELELETPIDTPHSLVVPAGDVVLKLNAPSHVEAEQEPDALERWSGRGAVRLVARDDARRAYLCERCRPGTQLSESGADEMTVVPGLLVQLSHVPTKPHPFRSLATEAERWLDEVPARYVIGDRPFERSLLELALDVFGTVDLSAAWLVNQDLHGLNVLRAQREPWLVIDPKPLVGERELDGVGLLRNVDSVADVRRWLDALTEIGLDRQRLRRWGVAHALAWGWDESGWSAESIAVARLIRDAT
jgi:streptomycin 6-kinase